MPILLNKTIRLFLDSIGRREEYEFYLKRFQARRTPAFALLCPERLGFEAFVSVLTFDLDFLLRLELAPAILLCGAQAGTMLDMLTEGEHPYSTLTARELDLEKIGSFLTDCRETHRAGILVFPGAEQEEALTTLLPTVCRRVHFLRPRGPLRTRAGEQLLYHYTARSDRPALQAGDQAIADMGARLLTRYPGLHISVASPLNLLQELFTIRGTGTVIRRGANIRRYTADNLPDRQRLLALLEESFGKPLANASCIDQAAEIFVDEAYRGVAMIERSASGRYLSKFAVGAEARGEGMAHELWTALRERDEPLFWRARPGNPINQWYEKHADGLHKTPDWIIFWRRVNWKQLSEIIGYCLEREDDFAEIPR